MCTTDFYLVLKIWEQALHWCKHFFPMNATQWKVLRILFTMLKVLVRKNFISVGVVDARGGISCGSWSWWIHCFVVRSHQWFVSCCTHLQCGSCVEVDWLCVTLSGNAQWNRLYHETNKVHVTVLLSLFFPRSDCQCSPLAVTGFFVN